jgi:predicted RecB family nuclease
MEGALFSEDGSLEYLFGFITADDGEPRFTAYWAHDRQAEKSAFECAMDFIKARLQTHPDAHIFHYASYEGDGTKTSCHGPRDKRSPTGRPTAGPEVSSTMFPAVVAKPQ